MVYLTDSSVDLDDPPEIKLAWAEKIIGCLLKNQKIPEAMNFIDSTCPSLWSENLVDLVLRVLIKIDLFEAISFDRKFGPNNNQKYLNLILDEVFLRTIVLI